MFCFDCVTVLVLYMNMVKDVDMEVELESYVAVSECVNVAQVYVGCDTYIYIVCTDTE